MSYCFFFLPPTALVTKLAAGLHHRAFLGFPVSRNSSDVGVKFLFLGEHIRPPFVAVVYKKPMVFFLFLFFPERIQNRSYK